MKKAVAPRPMPKASPAAGERRPAGLGRPGSVGDDELLEHAALGVHDRQRIPLPPLALGRRFDVITCLDSALLYCHTNADLTAFLDRCRAHLEPGGLLVAEMRNGAFFLGNTELLDGVRTRTVVWEGVSYTSHTRLWIDHAAQLLRRRREWWWPGAQPLVQRSAWRLLFPQELRHFLDHAGFDVLALFDSPGPRTEPPWAPDEPWTADAGLSEALSGDRLHLVARLRP